MFGGFNYGRYKAMQQQASKAERLEVTKDEFLRLAVESGMTQEKAEQTAKINTALGSEVLIGGKMLSIKKD